jgi:hypothetical protein
VRVSGTVEIAMGLRAERGFPATRKIFRPHILRYERTQKIVDLERELRFRDQRVNELKSEIDALRQVVRDMEEWVLCHEHRRSTRRCATIREMKEGPSSSTIRCGSQATASCCGQKPGW